jgi:hypothetical protein
MLSVVIVVRCVECGAWSFNAVSKIVRVRFAWFQKTAKKIIKDRGIIIIFDLIQLIIESWIYILKGLKRIHILLSGWYLYMLYLITGFDAWLILLNLRLCRDLCKSMYVCYVFAVNKIPWSRTPELNLNRWILEILVMYCERDGRVEVLC